MEATSRSRNSYGRLPTNKVVDCSRSFSVPLCTTRQPTYTFLASLYSKLTDPQGVSDEVEEVVAEADTDTGHNAVHSDGKKKGGHDNSYRNDNHVDDDDICHHHGNSDRYNATMRMTELLVVVEEEAEKNVDGAVVTMIGRRGEIENDESNFLYHLGCYRRVVMLIEDPSLLAVSIKRMKGTLFIFFS